jgi:hypothetical protein
MGPVGQDRIVTLILNAADVAGLLDPGVLLDALRSGFLAVDLLA